RESRQNPFSPSQRLVAGTGERLHGSVRRRCWRVEKHFRSGRKCGRGGVLPAGAGRQPVFRTGDRAPRVAVFPAHPSSMMPSGQEASLLIDTIAGKKLEPRVGVEPTTCRLRIGCSTTELPRLINNLRALGSRLVSHHGLSVIIPFSA